MELGVVVAPGRRWRKCNGKRREEEQLASGERNRRQLGFAL